MLPHVFETVFFSKLSIALLHFLWQGLILALCALLLLLLLRRKSAAARYLALLAVLGGMAICPVATFFLLPNQTLPPQGQLEHFQLSGGDRFNPNAAGTQLPPVTPATTISTAASSLIETTTAEPSAAPLPASSWQVPLHRIRIWLGDHLLWTAVLWLAGVALMLGRFLFGLFVLARCQRRGLQPISDALAERFAYLAKRLAVTRPVRLLISSLVQVPTVIGWLRPVILLPASALTGLAPAQLEAILAHELAHIRRRDYLVNLFQILVETFLFYHPAVWWVSNRLREEREHCCDDLVVGLGGSPLVYVKALTRLAEIGPELPNPALAGTGGKLLTRIRRLSGLAPARLDLAVSWPEGIISLLAILAIALLIQIQSGRTQTGDFRVISPFEIVSVNSASHATSGGSFAPIISGNGRFIVFCSRASDLIADDRNNKNDVFVYDRQQGTLECVSVTAEGRPGQGDSGWLGDELYLPSPGITISDDGRFVAFISDAPDLAPGKPSELCSLYLRDRQLQRTERISLPAAGNPTKISYYDPKLSGNGEFLVFNAGTPNAAENPQTLYCLDRQKGQINPLKGTGKYSDWLGQEASISADGRFVVICDRRPIADKPYTDILLLIDRKTGQTTEVAKRLTDEGGLSLMPGISADGRFVCYSYLPKTHPSEIKLFDTQTGKTQPLHLPPLKGPLSGRLALSADARYLAFSAFQSPEEELVKQNLFSNPKDLYCYDRKNCQLTCLLEGQTAGQWVTNASAIAISGDGRYIAYDWGRDQRWLEDTKWRREVYLYDRQADRAQLLSVSPPGQLANASVNNPAISSNGRFVSFSSDATNLIPNWPKGETGVFIRDRQTGATEAVSINQRGKYGRGLLSSLSADGRFVAFSSYDDNLVKDDNNERSDIFLRDRQQKSTELVSIGQNGAAAQVDFPTPDANGADFPALSANGRFIAFASLASNLVPGDNNRKWDIFVRDRELGRTERISLGLKGRESNGDSPGTSFYTTYHALAITPEGRFVVFVSAASNLVGQDRNQADDVFLWDRQSGATELISLDPKGRQWPGGAYGPAISDDGRFVVFAALSEKIRPEQDDYHDQPELYLRDRQKGTTLKIPAPQQDKQALTLTDAPSISGDGRLIAFAAGERLFLYDQEEKRTYRVEAESSLQAPGASPYLHGPVFAPVISSDGRFIAYRTSAPVTPGGRSYPDAIAVRQWREPKVSK
jgi:Tol biopolymer transport system component